MKLIQIGKGAIISKNDQIVNENELLKISIFYQKLLLPASIISLGTIRPIFKGF